LVDETDVHYLMSIPHVAGYANGVRWNDPAFGIDWPIDGPILSERDRTYPDWTP
jgi:dTDP-4-dehydrorhamnose 3,5-epimerase